MISKTALKLKEYPKTKIFCIVIILLSTIFISCSKKKIKYEEGYIEIDPGVQLFYQKVGDGPQKVIIPLGFWLYDDFKHMVTDSRTFVFYDMRNRGRSSYVTDSTLVSIEKDVADLDLVRRYFGYEEVSLIGESYLGMMVILYTMSHLENVDRVVQIGPVSYDYQIQYPDSLDYSVSQVDTTEFNRLNKLYNEGYHLENPRDFSQQYWDVVEKVTLVADTSYISQLGSQWGNHLEYENEWFPNIRRHLRFHFQSIQQLNITPEKLTSISQPVLTIHGTYDRNAAYGSGMEWAKLLPNAKLVTVQKAAHIPWIEQPELVFGTIDEFLTGNWPEVARIITPN